MIYRYINHMTMENFLRAISEKNKLRILNLINHKDQLCVCDLENILKLKQSTLSTYLSKLKQANILLDTKKSKWAYYRVNEYLGKSKKTILNEVLNEFSQTDIATEDLEKFAANKNSCETTKKILVVDDDNSLYSQIIEFELSKRDNIICLSAGIAPALEVNPLMKKLYPKEYGEPKFFTKNVSNFKKFYFNTVITLNDLYDIKDINIQSKKMVTINLTEIKSLTLKEIKKKLIERCEVYL